MELIPLEVMANRSYLYSVNRIPDGSSTPEVLTRGLAEHAYDIPIVFKILVSGNPTVCRSTIWDMAEKIAIVGEYEPGPQKLGTFLNRIKDPQARPFIDETMEFLSDEKNRDQYILLEAREIFDFDFCEHEFAEQNQRLRQEIQCIDLHIKKAVSRLNGGYRGAWIRTLRRIFDRPAWHPDELYDIGLGKWSNVLCFSASRGD